MWDWVSKVHKLKEKNNSFVIATVVGSDGSTPREVGAKMLVLEAEFFGTIGGGQLEHLVMEDARKLLKEGQSQTIEYPLGAKTAQCCGGKVSICFEIINSGPRLYLFGAGHVGQAVAQVLNGTAFQVQIVDSRKEWVESENIPEETKKFHMEWDDFIAQAKFDSQNTYAAVMTHDHDLDQNIIEKLIECDARYIGLIGSKAKWARFQKRLLARGANKDKISRVTCPLGIDVGGKSPKEVAVSLASELLSIYYERRSSTHSFSGRKIIKDGEAKGDCSLSG
jgi:xanthine dehydrogenase accessory factor